MREINHPKEVMMKKLFAMLSAAMLSLSLAVSGIAAQSSQVVVVLKNGKSQVFNLSDVLRIEFAETSSLRSIDPTGTWRRGQEGTTWIFTMGTDGRYFAQENGFAQVNRPGYFTPSGSFRIDYSSRDGVYTGYTEFTFGPDGRTASGTWNSYTPNKASSNVTWTRLN
jgi:hypothetical protein